ncbi:low affinity immunoglobulin epsilon Fc receptor-like [Haliotis cracherodii]|uniref:low affinity immunoglobulin epsilon Fc receptor-like n=1 Tax=Haliotis cracherodii TaxID=6455 RepID=UPI0039E7D06C
MNAVLCLFTVVIPVLYATSGCFKNRFDRLVTLDSQKARECPSSIQASPDERVCAALCAKEELCTAVTYFDGNCSMYRSTLTSYGKSLPGARHFIKAGAIPDPDPCLLSKGYTSVLSPRLCYKFISTANTWTHQDDLCQAEGGRLVVLNSRDKQEFMTSFRGQADVSNVVFVGMQRVNNVFTWKDGSNYTWKWASSEPDNVNGDENCVALSKYGFSDRHCDGMRASVCEIPL